MIAVRASSSVSKHHLHSLYLSIGLKSVTLQMIAVCQVCFSPVCDKCALLEQCHCDHKQNDAIWRVLASKLAMIDQHRTSTSAGEEVKRAHALLEALSKQTNYAPQFVTPMSQTQAGVPELSWRNASAVINCLSLLNKFVIYRVSQDKEIVATVSSVDEAVTCLLPCIHALQCSHSSNKALISSTKEGSGVPLQ